MHNTPSAAPPVQHTAVPNLGAAALFVALITTGLLAGVYYAYATSVMLALGKADDRTFVEIMNKINVVIVNPAFMLSFLGSVLFAIVAGAFYLRPELRPVLLWIAIAVVLNVASLIISAAFNIPLNNRLAIANDAHGPVDFAALRAAFEAPWCRWNIVRALANSAAAGVLGWALVQHGRLGR